MVLCLRFYLNPRLSHKPSPRELKNFKGLFEYFTGKPAITYDDKFKETLRPKAGSTQVISVNVSGVPVPKVAWFLADKPLSSSNGTKIETKDKVSTLTMKEIDGKSNGTIKVVAENKVGSDSAEFELQVKGNSFSGGKTGILRKNSSKMINR